MIFLTVGTQFAFDRLVRAVDDAVGAGLFKQEIFAQIGESEYRPRNFDFSRVLAKYDFDNYIDSSSGLIGHAGMGTITAAMDHNKPLLVMPRLKKFGEVVNDHQVTIAMMFEKMGLLLAAYDAQQVADRLECLGAFCPVARQSDCARVAQRVRAFIAESIA
ncbi:MAG: hypothetical protein A2Y12_04050 [Planctomycetes bacterium GWF2_42_9]|nr:MAG: hypothetical protein A2Y12_04050 [Planctomycetes bacterium GWF2_42_9]